MEIKRVALVIADIDGYDRLLKFQGTTLLHAEQTLSALLETILEAAGPSLTLSKLEGNAVFLYSVSQADEPAAAREVARSVKALFAAFAAAVQALAANANCACEACRQIHSLHLRAVLHFGEAAFKRIKQFDELAGESVILAHRLLKNIAALNGSILMTETFYRLSGGLGGQTPQTRIEPVESFGPLQVYVYSTFVFSD